MEKDSYIIPYELLPDSIQSVIKLNEFLLENPMITVKKGCEMFNVSKSTYYKYNNRIKKMK